MPLIKSSSIEEIRDRVPIEDLVGRYVHLKKTGSSYRGLSPFKNEKTPSFYVYPEKKFYYCFSTSQGGDVFKFLQVKEGLSFYEAAEFLAERYGIKLEYESVASDASAHASGSIRKQIFDINEDAAAYYSMEFFADTPAGESIRNYWVRERKFTLEDAKKLRIGFSPVDQLGLKKILSQKKYSPEALRGSGLFFAKDADTDFRRFGARFRGRLMIPISDSQGRVVAFTARKTEFTPNDIAYEEGKYVNSPETPIFKKNAILFNLDKAKSFAEKKGYFILVEGQLDTIRMYCSGLQNAVASQGTAAGAEHFALMKRYAGKVVLLFDGDEAGVHAALRAIPICLAAEVEPFVAALPAGEDPDSFISSMGAEAMVNLVENRKLPAIKYAVGAMLPKGAEPSAFDKRRVMEALFEMLNHCASDILRDDYLREIALNLGLNQRSVVSDYKKFTKSRRGSFRPGKPAAEQAEIKEDKSEQGMLTNAVYDALLVSLHFDNVAEGLSRILQDIWIEGDAVENRALRKLMAMRREGIDFDLNQIGSLFDDEDEKNLIYRLCSGDKDMIDNPVKYANDCVRKIHRNFVSGEIDALTAELKKNGGNDFEIFKKIGKLRKELVVPPAQLEA